MSDFAPLSAPAPITDAVDEAPTAGLLLRRARESARLHVEALAASLKVPVQKIEALEADRYDLLPDLVFVRALAASMCRTLGIDSRPVLERLPRRTQPRLAHDRDRVNAPFRGPHDAVGPGWRDQLVRPSVLAVLALLVGALVLVLLPQSVLDHVADFARSRMHQAPPARVAAMQIGVGPAERASAAPFIETSAAAPVDGPSLASYTVASTEQAAARAQPAVAQVAAHSAAASSGSVAAAVASAALVPAEAPSAAVPALAAATHAATAPAPPAAAALGQPGGVLVFRATGASWVEVRDAQGAVALRRMLAAGETVDASGTPPLSVTVGKVDVTQLSVRGQEFDLAAVARDNVARFQVK